MTLTKQIDVAIIGAGAMGSAAAYHLAQRGRRVVVFERYEPVHSMGSHGGYTRIIRHAYFESPEYVPLVLRSDLLWQQLEQECAQPLLIRTGCLDMGPENGMIFSGALQACLKHGLKHEHLPAGEAIKRWPQFMIPEDWHICYDPLAGFLIVDHCIRAHLSAAVVRGAELRSNENVLNLDCRKSPVYIETTSGSYSAAKVIVCGGSWNIKLLHTIKLPMHIQRQPVGWFVPVDPASFTPDRMPVYLAETSHGIFYGFPTYRHAGVKVARHGAGKKYSDADSVDREFFDADADELRRFISFFLPGVSTTLVEGQVCLYTMTPDEHFILDFHPDNNDVVIAAGFSGHGFKFAPVVGEIMADLCCTGKTDHPISTFRINRFQK